VILLLAAGLAAGTAGCREETAGLPEGSNVLLITVDTLRRDSLGFLAGTDGTPALDQLAAEGFVFPSAVAPVPLTLPSHSTMLTGLDPRHHGVRDNGQVLPDSIPTLAESFREAGYDTAAFVGGFPLMEMFGLDRGFDHYDDDLPGGDEGWLERPALLTSRAALDWIGEASSPWFVWIHYYDPHSPYQPPRDFWQPGSRGSYDGEVAYTDHAIGTLLAGIPAAERERTLTVFTADHGESFGEHDERDHGLFLYDTTMLVPLVFHYPGELSAGESPAVPRLVDLMPTLLELFDLPRPPETDGESLVGALGGDRSELPPAMLETRYPWTTYGWSPLSGLRTSSFKLIEAPRVELYDLQEDPAEENNLAGELPEIVTRMREELQALDDGDRPGADSVTDAETLERLRALGYVGGAPADETLPDDLPDPKDRIAERDRLLVAEALLQAREFPRALAAFEEVLAVDPRNRFAVLRAGITHLKAGSLPGAIEHLTLAVELDPAQPESRYALADALTRSGRFAESIPHWQETVRLQPRRVAGWSNLGSALGWSGRIEDAVVAFSRAVELEPNNDGLRQNLEAAREALAR
jgi:arylsulfatase A-like enzyme